MTVHPTMAGLPTSRRTILERLKREGEATAAGLSWAIGITVTGTRQHLSALQIDGLIARRELRDGRGRPKYMYSLTLAADALFPRNYSELTNELLEYVEDEDPQMLTRIFDRRAARRLREATARVQGLGFEEKVAVMAAILDEDGYLADFERRDDGAYVITEHNCAVLNVARKYGHACGSELQFLQDAMPEADVTRIAHRLAGGHVCAYEVREKSLSSAASQ